MSLSACKEIKIELSRWKHSLRRVLPMKQSQVAGPTDNNWIEFLFQLWGSHSQPKRTWETVREAKRIARFYRRLKDPICNKDKREIINCPLADEG